MRRIIGEKDDSFLDAIHSLISNYRNLCENNDFCGRYLNYVYTRASQIIANDILSTDWQTQPVFNLYVNNNKAGMYYNKTYTDIGIPWLNKLELYVQRNQNEFESMVLTDTAQYFYNPYTYEFDKVEKKMSIVGSFGSIKTIFMATSESISTASIIIRFDRNSKYLADKIELENIIKHDIDYLNDMLDENVIREEINKDIFVSNSSALNSSFSFVDVQYEYFHKCIYKLNWSEERQRVFQVLANLIKMNIEDLQLDDLSTDEDYKKSLYMFSKEFRDYSIMRDKFESFIKNTKDDVKQQFVDKFIMTIFGKWTPSGYPYGTDFKIDGYYCIGSYDLFFNTHIKPIDDNFINPSIRMIKQLLSYASKLYHESISWLNPATDFFTDSAIAAQRKRLNEAYNKIFNIRIGDIEYVQELLIKAKIFKNKEEILKVLNG